MDHKAKRIFFEDCLVTVQISYLWYLYCGLVSGKTKNPLQLRTSGKGFGLADNLMTHWLVSKKPQKLVCQRWSRRHKARGQGQGHKENPRPRPRTAFPRTDTLEAKDRNARGQGQGPRTQAQVLSKKKKKVFTKIFQPISTKTRFPKNFSSAPQNFNNSKNSAVLEPRTG